MKPKVSLLVLVYKNNKDLIKLMQSVEDTTNYDNYEWVIRDNSIANVGVCRGTNELLRRANGDVFVLLNDDMYFTEKGWLEKCLEQMEEKTILTPVIYEGRDFGPECSVCPMIFPKELYWEVGGWDENFIGYGSDDTDYIIRARILGWKLKQVDIGFVHEGSVASGKVFKGGTHKLQIINNNRIQTKWGKSMGEIAND